MSELKRVVGLGGAINLGLGSILGTGAFVSLAMASGMAGPHIGFAIIIAGLVALGNGLSSARLAATYPVSGGTYEYAYKTLNAPLGFAAGWTFLCAKSASAAAAALGCASYLLDGVGMGGPVLTRIIATSLIVVLAYLSMLGLQKSNRINTLLVAVTIAGLLAFVFTCFGFIFAEGVHPDWMRSLELNSSSLLRPHMFEAAAFLFVAFTGYGRVASLGEEVLRPTITIPRAVISTLLISTVLYLLVTTAAITSIGAAGFAQSVQSEAGTLPKLSALSDIVARLGHPWVARFVAVAAASAMIGVLLNLITGLSRVVLAMARRDDLPSKLALVDRSHKAPYLAIWAIAGTTLIIAMIGGFYRSWQLSAFTVLVYYAITNLAALRLKSSPPFARVLMALSLAACLCLASFIDIATMGIGIVLIATGFLVRAFMHRQKS